LNEKSTKYHADVVSIQQNLGKLRLAAGVVANPSVSISPTLQSPKNLQFCHIFQNHIYRSIRVRSFELDLLALTDVVIEAKESATEFCREVRYCGRNRRKKR
jgi:hypothetical protein